MREYRLEPILKRGESVLDGVEVTDSKDGLIEASLPGGYGFPNISNFFPTSEFMRPSPGSDEGTLAGAAMRRWQRL